MEILLNYWTLAAAAILLPVSACALLIKRKTISAALRTLLLAVCVLSAVYLAFVLMLTIGFGSHVPPEPAPISPA